MIKKSFLTLLLFITANIFNAQIDSAATKDNHSDTSNNGFNIPIFSTTGADAESDLDQQDASSLLQSSRDVFTQFASFQFGAARYRIRGYAAENQIVMINGVNVNNLETGFSSWSNWGGLNDVTRFVENRFGLIANRYGFSGAGGYTNIDSRASSFRKGTRVSYASSNRIFRHRAMITHSTGMLKNGWALTLSASTRQGDEVYIPGTYFNANSYYASVDKKFTDKHLLSFTGYFSPIEQGRASAQQKETFELTGTNYYNSFWGYQNGKVRNSSVSKVQRPMLMLSHVYNIKSDAHLTSTVFYNFGKSSLSGLNWNNSTNPRPDYYRYLPSYYYQSGDVLNGNLLKYNWENNINSTQQINWDRLITANQSNLYTIPSQVGQGISNTTETRSRYIVEKRIENLSNLGINVVYNARIKNTFISAGFNANRFNNHRYKEMEDLLGGNFWLDVDQFAENLGVDNTFAQNDIDQPDKKIYEGDKFGYDYNTRINKAETWGQAEYSSNNIDVYGALSLSSTKLWREGLIANGKFPTSSKGLSEKLSFNNFGLKGGITYKFNGRHFMTANASYITRAPEANNVFVSPRVRNDIVNGVESEKVLSNDINYLIKYPGFKLRFTGYYTQVSDQTWLRTFWSDEYNNNVNYIMTGVNQNHRGIELGVEKTFFASHTIQGALGMGQFVYTNRPTAQAWQDNNNTSLFVNRTVYLTDYKVGSGPQLVSGIGYRYNSRKFWFAGIYFNYFDQIYIEPNPDRRTAEALVKYATTDPQYKTITDQEKLDAFYTVNVNVGKSFRIKRKYFLNFNVSVNNLLNNQNIITSGFEQLRWDQSNIDRFPNKYYYMTGLTYMAMVNFNF